MKIIHVVSVSGGKDSVVTLAIAIERVGLENVRAIFCDTGNEHQLVYEYLDYMEKRFGIVIDRLTADFSTRIAAKRKFIANDQRIGRRNGKKLRWTNKKKRTALAVLQPTGNPFLDLCIWKGRFPSRRAQFCTEHLKKNMAVAYQMALIDEGYDVISWQGVRRDESLARKNAKKSERLAPGMYAFRPIVEWTAKQVFDYHHENNIKPNPLYKLGMNRVGCMPCINVSKRELCEISRRFPEVIDRIEKWELLVGQACKRGFSTMLAAKDKRKDRRLIFNDLNIRSRVKWSKTKHGGRQYDIMLAGEPKACSSAYGLCE